MMTLTPAWRSKVSLVEETATLLRERVFDGRYLPGARLPQAELSAELGVSRTPLREALRLLEQEGIVRAGSRGRARVVTMETQEVLDALEFREAVEGLAARLACSRLETARLRTSSSSVVLDELKRIVGDQGRALGPGQEQRFAALSAGFHVALLRASGNSFVQRQLTMVRLTEQVFRPPALSTTEAATRGLSEHVAIVTALEIGDKAAAEELVRNHLHSAVALLRKDEALAHSPALPDQQGVHP